MTKTNTNKELAQRLHKEVWEEGNLDLIDELVAEDYVEHSTAHAEKVSGRDEYRKSIERLRSAFPDLTLTIKDTVAEGDKVVSRVIFGGTHKGKFQNLDPTGKSVEFEVMVINRFVGGRLAEAWVQTDIMGLMHQLGVVEEADY